MAKGLQASQLPLRPLRPSVKRMEARKDSIRMQFRSQHVPPVERGDNNMRHLSATAGSGAQLLARDFLSSRNRLWMVRGSTLKATTVPRSTHFISRIALYRWSMGLLALFRWRRAMAICRGLAQGFVYGYEAQRSS